MGFELLRNDKASGIAAVAPYWSLIVLTATFAAIPWLRSAPASARTAHHHDTICCGAETRRHSAAPPEHIEKALKLRRNQIVGDCSQLKRDLDSYNDNNIHGTRLQLSINFEKDIAELEILEDFGAKLKTAKPR